MIKARISEIFSSFQGEGPYLGCQQIFVRFFGCDIHCDWCDTPASKNDSRARAREYSPEELLKKILSFKGNFHSLSLTGGEPLLQADFLKSFLPLAKKHGVKIYLETNGILHQNLHKIIDAVDIIAMDVKLPTSTKCRAFWKEHERFLRIASAKDVFVKVVISKDTLLKDVLRASRLIANIDKDFSLILQPNFFDLKKGVLRKCLLFQNACAKILSDVRMIPQVHKFLKIP